MQKIAGNRRAAHTLIASCHSPSDDPPSPMNVTATRSLPARRNPMASPAVVSEPIDRGAAAGRMPRAKTPTGEPGPSPGRPALSHLSAAAGLPALAAL